MATRRKRKSTARARRTTVSRRRTASRVAGGSAQQMFTKLQQARRAEKNAIRKIGVMVRRHQMAIEKMRKTIQMRIAEKSKQIARDRKQLAKKHAMAVRKLRRQHSMRLKQLRKQLVNVNKSQFSKTKATKKSRVGAAKRRKASGKKVVAFRRRSTARASFRRAA